MKKALLPLLLIATMVLAVTIASASNFRTEGYGITAENGWDASPGWVSGAWTETHATASHDLHTGASGAFSYNVLFRLGDADNIVKIGLKAANGDHYITIDGNAVSFDGNSLGTLDDGYASSDYQATISSEDGNNWAVSVYTLSGEGDFAVNAVPTKALLDISKDNPDQAVDGPTIHWVDFQSAETATSTPTATPSPTAQPSASPDPTEKPDVSPTPTEQPSAPAQGPAYDVAAVQDFYSNAYNDIHSPYDIITYDGKGGYTITPNTNFGSTGPAPAATYAVSGQVTAAADGKPVVGASVVLGSAIQKTNYNGEYRFDGTTGGSYDIAVSADGYASQTQSVNVDDNKQLNFALAPASAAGTTVASAANETVNKTTNTTTTAPVTNTTTTNTTTTTTVANNTTKPAPTQTKSPGFEAIVAAMALIAVAGLVLFVNRKK